LNGRIVKFPCWNGYPQLGQDWKIPLLEWISPTIVWLKIPLLE
jgi:hypothetical protein